MLAKYQALPQKIKQYLIVTGNYWAFTLTDGALRMLVIMHFHQLGYTPLEIAMLFVFYEIFGVVTNLLGGYFGARFGLNRTMNIGLGLQVLALGMLLLPSSFLTLAWVMAAQGLSGIAKDLNKMSAKSSIKFLVGSGEQQQLYQWVAKLTGSKNALKGVGFFMGGALLTLLGFRYAIAVMALALCLVWLWSLYSLRQDLGKASNKAKFKEIFSKSSNINILSAARLFLFAARDVWFLVALPLYLGSQFGWDHIYVGGFLAIWVMAYGLMQTLAPRITIRTSASGVVKMPAGRTSFYWICLLSIIPAGLALTLNMNIGSEFVLLIGLMIFGAVFAINSSMHSYLILSYASDDGVSLDVGFYYMANAMGRLLGTVLSGYVYQVAGLAACLWVSSLLLLLSGIISFYLPKLAQTS